LKVVNLIDIVGLLEYGDDRVNSPAYDTFAISNYVKVPFKCERFTRSNDAEAFPWENYETSTNIYVIDTRLS